MDRQVAMPLWSLLYFGISHKDIFKDRDTHTEVLESDNPF